MRQWITLALAACAIAPRTVAAEEPSRHSYMPEQGLIADKNTAIKIAEAVLFPIYGEDKIKSEEPFRVTLADDIWRIEGKTLPEGTLGGVVLIEISKRDGRIVKVMHGK